MSKVVASMVVFGFLVLAISTGAKADSAHVLRCKISYTNSDFESFGEPDFFVSTISNVVAKAGVYSKSTKENVAQLEFEISGQLTRAGLYESSPTGLVSPYMVNDSKWTSPLNFAQVSADTWQASFKDVIQLPRVITSTLPVSGAVTCQKTELPFAFASSNKYDYQNVIALDRPASIYAPLEQTLKVRNFCVIGDLALAENALLNSSDFSRQKSLKLENGPIEYPLDASECDNGAQYQDGDGLWQCSHAHSMPDAIRVTVSKCSK